MSEAHNRSLFWGTYRPNVYFGARSRSTDTVLAGLMWFGLGDYAGFRSIRHSCEQGDNLAQYGWAKHDGRTFGVQEINDPLNNVTMTTSFVKGTGANQNDWALRLSGVPHKSKTAHISLLFYVALDTAETGEVALRRSGKARRGRFAVDGQAPGLGNFSLFFLENEVGSGGMPLRFWGTQSPRASVWNVKDRVAELILTEARSKLDPNATVFPPPAALFQLPNHAAPGSNIFVTQKTLEAPFEVDLVFMSQGAGQDSPTLEQGESFAKEVLGTRLTADVNAFDSRFEDVFGLDEAGLGKKHIKMAKFALSNMIGALGYFYGSGLQKDDSPMGFHETAPQVLFTAVPSRPFFPRGFLWDEGFHQLLVQKWDNDLSMDILQHWLNLLDDDGWVAREQILGPEARSKVPSEFQVQDSTFANPPTWLFPVLSFVADLRASESTAGNEIPPISTADDLKYLRRRLLTDRAAATVFLLGAYDKLKLHYSWMRRTQRGRTIDACPECDGFRWTGRTVNHTLTSGLDDYPRANPPDEGELHVDLLSWIGLYAKALAELAGWLGKEDDRAEFLAQLERVQNTLEKVHWNDDESFYQDVVMREDGTRTFIGRIGYVGLFPVILGVVPPCHPSVEGVLELLRDPDHLWSDYGIMSLSASDDDFGGGENYWKGPIWINVNYLVLAALKKWYSECPGSLGAEAQRIYAELRRNVMENVYKEYRRTGYIWEQYSPLNGAGQRSHPFTGWSALVLLIMAEKY
ncbi:glycoside hydrolase [Hyaloraphidium curvatum]|nr:glycoside hydrolase [Hyaloraphidium curvatum]